MYIIVSEGRSTNSELFEVSGLTYIFLFAELIGAIVPNDYGLYRNSEIWNFPTLLGEVISVLLEKGSVN